MYTPLTLIIKSFFGNPSLYGSTVMSMHRRSTFTLGMEFVIYIAYSTMLYNTNPACNLDLMDSGTVNAILSVGLPVVAVRMINIIQ